MDSSHPSVKLLRIKSNNCKNEVMPMAVYGADLHGTNINFFELISVSQNSIMENFKIFTPDLHS